MFEGQYFPEFRRETHVCEAFPIPEHWQRYKALDYGFDMLAVGWFAVDEQGTAYLYKEFCEGKDLGEGHDGLILSDAANAISGALGRGGTRCDHLQAHRLTSGTGGRTPDAARQTALRNAECFWEKRKTTACSAGSTCKEYLKVRKDTGKPSLMIFSNCTQTIKSLPMLLHDEKHPDDVANDPHELHPPGGHAAVLCGRPSDCGKSNRREYNELTTEEEMGNVFSY